MAYRILLVDDETQLRRMVGEILEQEGYAVLLAADCAQGETIFCREQPDAVLLDVMLPDGDGFSLFQKLRAVRDVPVLFLSARDEDEARLRGLGLGADDYITKPFLQRSTPCCTSSGKTAATSSRWMRCAPLCGTGCWWGTRTR